MAKVDVKMPEEFLLKISRLGEKTDEIIPRVLETGGEVVLDKVKSNLQSVVGSGTKYESRTTGELAGALGLSPVLQDRDGNHNIKIGFSEPRRDGESNAKIANIIEYGKSGQPAKPFLKPAKSATKKTCAEAMKAKLEQELGQI
ncbi:MAG: HK97 gp10 family phage protein [Saccharofermentanales bacterium]|nr:HK97 gp10 family phage protein [Syntrophorhabdaceae bacterium]